MPNKTLICTGCQQEIKGEYGLKKVDDKEECYHQHCARIAGELHLPVQIRFTD